MKCDKCLMANIVCWMSVHLSPMCRISFHEVLSSELDDLGGGSPMLSGLGHLLNYSYLCRMRRLLIGRVLVVK